MPVKKVILLIFTVILCLCLCACNVDEKYATLLKHIDSGNYEGIKSEMMILSPDFKVEQEQLLEKAVWYEKYQTLITLLEQEDYDGAMADLENRIPKPPRPASTEVAITNDNWSEYFEILEYPVTDPFGRLYMYCSAFVPKAEYIDRIDYDTEFSMDISHIDNFIGVYTYSFLPETGEFVYLNEEYSYVDSPMINITQINNFFLKDFVDNNCQISYDHCPVVLCNGNVFNDGVQKYSLEIDNIQGSIFIFN